MPNVAISPDTRKRLNPLLSRLASDHPGEVIATVKAIKRTLASVGCDLHDLADVLYQAPLEPSPAQRQSVTWRQQAEQLLRDGTLTPWERRFLSTLLSCVHPSPKQMAILHRIVSANAGGGEMVARSAMRAPPRCW
jgi:hypothetical protein